MNADLSRASTSPAVGPEMGAGRWRCDMASSECPSCSQHQSVGQGACPDCLAKFAARRIVPADHEVRYMYGAKTVTKRAVDLRPLKAIRAKCIDCSGGSTSVATECHILDCPLWPYRLGRRPKFVKGAVVRGIDSGAAEGHVRGPLALRGSGPDMECGTVRCDEKKEGP
jgi:hypothetical protein